MEPRIEDKSIIHNNQDASQIASSQTLYEIKGLLSLLRNELYAWAKQVAWMLFIIIALLIIIATKIK